MKDRIKYVDLLRLKEETFKYFTLEESLEAVRELSGNLAYVKHQTPEICMEAVKNGGFNLMYVKHQTEAICKEAYKREPGSVTYIRIDTKDEELREKRERYVRYLTLEDSLRAVRRDGDNLRHVKYQTEEICLEAVKQNGWALAYVINQTEEMCIEAYKTNPESSIKFTRDSLEDYRKRRLNLIKNVIV